MNLLFFVFLRPFVPSFPAFILSVVHPEFFGPASKARLRQPGLNACALPARTTL
jgi:hypothetical protein